MNVQEHYWYERITFKFHEDLLKEIKVIHEIEYL